MSALQELAIDLEAEGTIDFDDDTAASPIRLGALGAWFASLSIGRKITWFFGLNLAFALLAGLAIIVAFIQVRDRAEQINTAQGLAVKAEQLAGDLGNAQRHSEMWLASGDAARAGLALAALDNADQKLANLGADRGLEQISAMTAAMTDLRDQLGAYETANARADGASVMASAQSAVVASRAFANTIEQKAANMSLAGASFVSSMLIWWVALAGILTLLTLVAQRYFDQSVGG